MRCAVNGGRSERNDSVVGAENENENEMGDGVEELS